MNFFIKNKIELFILMILPVLFLYRMIFFGEIVTTNDELERHPINEWRDTYLDENKDTPQWYPNLFSGMPSYGGYIYTSGDPTKYFRSNILFNNGLRIWFYLGLSGIGMYALLTLLGVSRSSALIGGAISALTPYTFGLINAGHLNKIFSMAYIPWVIAAAIYLIDRLSIKAILLLALATALQLWANHPQVAYYTWMVIGFYYVWIICSSIRNKTISVSSSLYPLGGMIFGIALALVMVSDPYLDIYKFQKYSNRGAKSVLDQSGQTESGTDWNYATQWSFHPFETLSFIYPYHYGLQNISDTKRGAYWGYMPFTQSTHYLGLVAIIFAILGALLKKPDRLGLIFWAVTVLTLVTGFGSYLPLLYKPFYSLLPFFSKFRIPSMIYMLLAITIPLLAARGLDIFLEHYEENKELIRKSIYVAGGIAGLTIVLIMFGESLFSFSSSSDLRYNNPGFITKLRSARIELFNKGLFLALAVSLSVLGLIWALVNRNINRSTFYYGLLTIALFDLWMLNSEFMNIKPPKNMDMMFQKNPAIEYIDKDPDHFRVFPADRLGSNHYSYWNIESIGGYRPIKLRHYQDLMDAKGFNRPQVMDMLNVKYVLTNKKINNPDFLRIKEAPGLYENTNVLPKAWIVGNIKSVKSQRESLMEVLLGGFDPSRTAIVYNYNGTNNRKDVDGQVSVVSKTENKIELISSSSTGGLLVLSEIYYEPGWIATVNGTEAPIYQTNHVLRSVEIPPGENEVIFEYDTNTWQKTRMLSRVSLLSVLLLLGIIFWTGKEERIE